MHIRRILLTVLMTVHILAAAAQSAAKQQTLNTAAAAGAEELYRLEEDSIRDNKLLTVGFTTMRFQLKMAEKSSRQMQLFSTSSPVYVEMVAQCEALVDDYNALCRAADSCHVDMSDVKQGAGELMDEAYALVRQTVVTGMGSAVPDPFKVNLDKLLKGEDETPPYISDPDRPDTHTDGANMLLPDERYRLVNHCLLHLRAMRRAMQAVTAKLTVDFAVRYRMRRAPDFRVAVAPLGTEALRQAAGNLASFAR